MEQWILVMAMMSGAQVGGPIVELGPMPFEVCIKVAGAMERTSRGMIFAGCTAAVAKEHDHDKDHEEDNDSAAEEPERH
jgi:hypothetical protein